jgi:hypothetical protein
MGIPSPIKHAKKVACVGGGLGVAPIFPQAKSFKENGAYVIAILGFRTSDLMFWEDKFRACCDELILCTNDGSAGMKGLITDGVKAALAKRAEPTAETILLGAVVSFFDTLGIGCFAPSTAWLKFRRLVPDRLIPPTILVGLTITAVVESIIFLLQLGVRVDPVLLVGCIIACMTGGLLGAGLVHRTRVWIVQLVVAV